MLLNLFDFLFFKEFVAKVICKNSMKKINLKQEEQFLLSSYKEEGIYHNVFNDEILLYSYKNAYIIFVGKFDVIGHLFELEEKKLEAIPEAIGKGFVSENFTLKLAAMLIDKTKVNNFDV